MTVAVIRNGSIEFRWDEEHGDPERWRQLRRRWDLIHTGRVILDSTGFVLVAVAVVWQ